jgi:hypothetical protein
MARRGVARTCWASAAVSGFHAQVSGVRRAWVAREIIELKESVGWTTVGIARVLIEEQARTIAARREPDRRKTCCLLLGGVSAWQPASLPSPPAIGGRSLSRKEGRR